MSVQWAFLRSKVARRLLLIFVGCALLPIGVLSLITFDRVTDQLYEQTHRRLHRASKATALGILSRLQSLAAQLERLEARAGARDLASLRRAAQSLDDGFVSLVVLGADGRRSTLLGRPEDGPASASEAPAKLAPGRTVLTTERGPQDAARVLLWHQLDAARHTTIVGRVDLAPLLDLAQEPTLPPLAEFCVLDEHRRLLRCSLSEDPVLPATARAAIASASSGHFEWTLGDQEYLAYYWSIFLEASFSAPPWTLLVAEPKYLVLAPISKFFWCRSSASFSFAGSWAPWST